ncbi:hypothetical protein TSTA_110330 [Talaromyces stipitatus ATCC 10500]|uniref:Uncharacterized protein n=1 Tax=Talaromyces stipitatus (strain ATCC 10500 / CBS 375.48 / QM 6759 / NRRL 1006) TaxID=441959 RepID=B8MUT3_TALSN|nr:uncharacterized protein TSTA_110330 [Talaromyces stipitatus ATCC 10500]EED11853.1 hypothetical protein TSTA_110330 [Talaromyces stipitatus ATCC 10500]
MPRKLFLWHYYTVNYMCSESRQSVNLIGSPAKGPSNGYINGFRPYDIDYRNLRPSEHGYKMEPAKKQPFQAKARAFRTAIDATRQD